MVVVVKGTDVLDSLVQLVGVLLVDIAVVRVLINASHSSLAAHINCVIVVVMMRGRGRRLLMDAGPHTCGIALVVAGFNWSLTSELLEGIRNATFIDVQAIGANCICIRLGIAVHNLLGLIETVMRNARSLYLDTTCTGMHAVAARRRNRMRDLPSLLH